MKYVDTEAEVQNQYPLAYLSFEGYRYSTGIRATIASRSIVQYPKYSLTLSAVFFSQYPTYSLTLSPVFLSQTSKQKEAS